MTDLAEKSRCFSENLFSAFKIISLPDNPNRAQFNLIANYELFERYFPLPFTTYLDDFLKWILRNRQLFALHGDRTNDLKSLNTDFICFRGVLTTIMVSPYEQNAWRIVAHHFKGTIYLMLVKVTLLSHMCIVYAIHKMYGDVYFPKIIAGHGVV